MTVFTSPLVPGITFEVVNLTPQLAKEFLSHLPERQRQLSLRTVDRYASDLLSEQFPFTGDSIKFNIKGELIDGQHRCNAVVESEVAVPMLVIRGLGDDMIRFFDGGRSRKFSDDLRIQGYANHMMLSAVTTRLWHWEHGNYGYQEVPFVANPLYANTAPTRAMLWKTLEAHPELPEVVTHANRLYRYTRNAPASVTGLTWLLLGEADVDAREKFFYELVEGPSQNGPEYPINVLRKSLNRQLSVNEDRPGHVWLAYYVKAYNAWAEGRSLSYLRMPTPSRWNNWPVPVGLARPGVQPSDMGLGEDEVS